MFGPASHAESDPGDLGIDALLDSAEDPAAGQTGPGEQPAHEEQEEREPDPWDLDDHGDYGANPIITPLGSGGPAAPPQRSAPDPRGTPPAVEQPAAEQPERSRLRRLYHFYSDSRMGMWRRRALITILVGVVFSIIFTWRLGLTVAVIVAIGDTIYRSRTMASVPAGIRLTHAQRRTQRQLARLERSGYRSLHSRRIPSSQESIDHLVVGPTGIYSIDSESWDRRLPIRTRNARQLWHGPASKKDRLDQATWECGQATELLSAALGRRVTVRAAMAVYGPKVPWDIATIRDVDVFRGSRLRKYLRRRAKTSGLPPLREDEIDKIHRAAMVALPLADSGSAATPVG